MVNRSDAVKEWNYCEWMRQNIIWTLDNRRVLQNLFHLLDLYQNCYISYGMLELQLNTVWSIAVCENRVLLGPGQFPAKWIVSMHLSSKSRIFESASAAKSLVSQWSVYKRRIAPWLHVRVCIVSQALLNIFIVASPAFANAKDGGIIRATCLHASPDTVRCSLLPGWRYLKLAALATHSRQHTRRETLSWSDVRRRCLWFILPQLLRRSP
jgi:hypothetical protein